MRNFSFHVTQGVLDLGINVQTATVTGVQNTGLREDFESYKEAVLSNLRQQWEGKNYKDDPVLVGFRDLHTKVGRSNREYVASPEGLRWLFLKRGRFPHINTLVDIYNLVSLRSGLALGAHDVEKVNGNVTLRLTAGDEIFVPLGEIESVAVFPGEYAYVDDGNNIICRMEVLQVEPTKVVEETSDVFIIIQGNEKTTANLVNEISQEVCELITKYCGGSWILLSDL